MPRTTTITALILSIASLLAALAFAADMPRRTDMPAPTVLHDGKVPVGSLGRPLGTYVTIEGHRYPHQVQGSQWVLVVEKVDDKKLLKPVNLWIDNIGRLPASGPIILKGYESARMVGVPPAYAAASRQDHQKPPAWTLKPNARWQMELFFTVIKTVARGHPPKN